jgi:hypothetical protein
LWEVTLERCGIINSCLLRVLGDEAKDRVKSSAGVLIMPAHGIVRTGADPCTSSIPYFLAIVKHIIDCSSTSPPAIRHPAFLNSGVHRR